MRPAYLSERTRTTKVTPWGWDAFLQQRSSIPQFSSVYQIRSEEVAQILLHTPKEAFQNHTFLYFSYLVIVSSKFHLSMIYP